MTGTLKSKKSRLFLIVFTAIIGAALQASIVWGLEIHDAAKQGDLSKVELLLASKPQLINAQDKDNFTPLCLAGQGGHKEVVELLITKGADVNFAGGAPLVLTALKGHKEVAELLIAKGANANVGVGGVTPLLAAASGGHTELAEFLIAKGADVNAKNKNGWTPLYSAASNGHKELAELLIAK
jgi:ankyrin repeat protein